MTYQQAIDYLYSSLPMYQRIGNKAFKKDLSNTLALCNALGNPHKNFKSVHIAGTNGKGTSAHALAAILQSAGYKTGLYTSPHLKSFTERIKINGEAIPENAVVQFVSNHSDLLDSIAPSFFETTVVMAFDHFAKEEVDITVIEVGMGGRFDSTNVITPILSLITAIGWDHQQYLGDSLEKIAFEKAGIIKAHTPVVIGADQPDLLKVFEAKAHEVQAPLSSGQLQIVKKEESGLISRRIDVLDQGDLVFKNLELSLMGDYFLNNISGILQSVKQLRKLGYNISDDSIRQGLSDVQRLTGLKGRWQILGKNPLVICDVGHNQDGIKSILHQLSLLTAKKVHFIFGTVNDKELEPVLNLLPKEFEFYFCQANIPRSLPSRELKELASTFGLSGEAYRDVNEAMNQAKRSATNEEVIFVGGSTFVVAEIDGL